MARVLVIEDNPVNMKLARFLLGNVGHTVLCAADAESGLSMAYSEHPDLVLMDFQLPGMDGLAATVLLKQHPATAAIPVIALTAMAMQADRERSRLAGCDAYIAKPLRYQELYATINALLPGGTPAEATPPTDALTAQPGFDGAAVIAGGRDHLAVDVSVLESLIGHDPAVTLDFLRSFQINAAKIALALKAACVEGLPLQAARQAHKLKSSAYTMGAAALGGLCVEMETAGKSGCVEALKRLLPRFEQELAAVDGFLAALLDRPGAIGVSVDIPDDHDAH